MGGGFPESLNVNKLYQTLLHSIVLLCGDHSVTDCDMARTMRVSGKEPKNKGWLAKAMWGRAPLWGYFPSDLS